MASSIWLSAGIEGVDELAEARCFIRGLVARRLAWSDVAGVSLLPMPRKKKKTGGGVSWLSVFIVGAFVLLFCMVVSIFGFLGWVKSYLNGEEFREIVSAKTSEALKGKGSFEEIHWTDSSAYSDGFSARGYSDAPFSRITANGVRADVDFGAVRDGVWKVTGIGLNRVVLLINEEDRLAGKAGREEMDLEIDESSGFFKALLPGAVEVDEVSILDSNLVAVRNDGERISLSGVETRLRPVAGSGAWSVSGKGGDLEIPGVPELEVKSFALRVAGSEMFITDAAFGLLNGARLSGSGEMEFGGKDRVDLRLKIADLDVDEVVGPQWRDRISGIARGDAKVERLENTLLKKVGTVEVVKGVLEEMEVLDMVADYAKAEQFRRLVLHEATADFEQVGDRLKVTNLVLQSDGLTRLTGELVVENGVIDGKLKVGVTPGTLKWIPGAEQQVFVELKDGFLWTDVMVAGPVENPSEDLSMRLKSAAVKAVVEGAIDGVLGDVPGRAVEAGKAVVGVGVGAGSSAVDTAAEGAKAILDTLTPLFKQD